MSKQTFDPSKDGIDHINIYSRGRTEIGRYLSNFTKFPFEHPQHGKFLSVEGLWYWLLTPVDNPLRDKLRTVYGYSAKKLGRELSNGADWGNTEEFKQSIYDALELKAQSCEELTKDLIGLPFVHYYTFGSKVIVPDRGLWVIDFWNNKYNEHNT